MKLCSRCRVNPRGVRKDGRVNSWCRPCEAQQKKEYNKSTAGRAAQDRYQTKLRQEEKTRNAVSGRPWTKQDYVELTRLYVSGMLLKDIAVQMDRTLYAVINQLPHVFLRGVLQRKIRV